MTNLNLLEKVLWMVQNRVFSQFFLQKLVDKHYPIVPIDISICFVDSNAVPEFFYPWPSTKEVDVRDFKWYLHPKQRGSRPAHSENGLVSIQEVFNHLKETKLLEHCIGLRELWAFKNRKINFFDEYFQGKSLPGWRDVIRLKKTGILQVPILEKKGKDLIIEMEEINEINRLDGNCPAILYGVQ